AAANHLTQLVVPFGLLAPQPYAGVAATVIIITQLWLIVSGNFAWLNWLTVVVATSVVPWTPLTTTLTRTLPWATTGTPTGPPPPLAAAPAWHGALVISVTVVFVVLSYWPARNLLSRRQRMNVSFNPLHLANTYGAFGHITKTRYEVV